MCVMNHNWSATKQRHLQTVAEISRHSVLSGDRIRQCGTSSGSRHKDTDHSHNLLNISNNNSNTLLESIQSCKPYYYLAILNWVNKSSLVQFTQNM